MSPEIAALIARRLAAPKQFKIVTTFADGTFRQRETETIGQAENWAVGEKRKIGKDLISHGDDLGHKAGDIVRVVSVEISAL